MRARQELIDIRTDKCAKGATGDTYTDCLEAAEASVEDLDTLLDVLDAVKNERKDEGKGILWWIGLAAVVGGGIVTYKIIKKRRGSGRARTERPKTAQLVTS